MAITAIIQRPDQRMIDGKTLSKLPFLNPRQETAGLEQNEKFLGFNIYLYNSRYSLITL